VDRSGRLEQELPIRAAQAADIEIICEHRRAMFLDMGHTGRILDPMIAAFRPWLKQRLESGEYRGWLAGNGGEVIAGAGLWLMPWPPHLVAPDQPRANILNVYTKPEWRGRGVARQLMETILNWCAAQGIRAVILHASDAGKPLYRSMGFEPTNEMRLILPE